MNLRNSSKILGINERNLRYIRPHNLKRAKRIADDKLLTKKILSKADIPTPKLCGVITNLDEFDNFDWNSLPKSFVLKPVTGLEGGGIEIFYNRDKHGNWIRADKSRVSLEDLRSHVRNILDGQFSLGNIPDRAFFEERLKNHKIFKYYAYKGAPDIRMIVYNNVPVMSYVRLPTVQSEGKANMQKGAIASGIDMATGITTTSVIGKERGGRGYVIEYVPGTNLRLSGLKIPYWNTLLKLGIQCQRATELGYCAADFLIDREQGPMIVELNARPGLSIQIANRDGLKWRLEKVEGLKVKTVEQGVRLAKDLFGGEVEEEMENISGKQVIGFVEKVTLHGKEEKQEEAVKAKIDTGALQTSIDTKLLSKLGYQSALEHFDKFRIPENLTREKAKELTKKLEEKIEQHEDIDDIAIVHSSHGTTLRPMILTALTISGTKVEVKANAVDRSKLIYPVIVGRRDLNKFIIDPAKTFRAK